MSAPRDVAQLLLRIPDVAHVLGVGRTKAYELAATGRLPVVRIDGCVRVPAAELEAWLADGRLGDSTSASGPSGQADGKR